MFIELGVTEGTKKHGNLEKIFGATIGPILGPKSRKKQFFAFLSSNPPFLYIFDDFIDDKLSCSTSKNTSYKTFRKLGNYINGRHMRLQSTKYMGKIWGNFVNWLNVDEILLKSIPKYFYRILQQKLGLGKWKPVKIKILIFLVKNFPGFQILAIFC